MIMNDYTVICETDKNYKTEYVFQAISFHDCKLQAKEHGLFGDRPIRIEQRFEYFTESEGF
tara:strand:- start:3429 stop:3611 length:183 start_codon:yes stop_codon:yes gene_type:complete